jgi:hypothetical protein
MRQVVGAGQREKACPYKCELVQISDQLWLCPHVAWGWASNLAGAEADARSLMQRAGGYAALLERQHAQRHNTSHVVSQSEMQGT